MQYNVSVQKFEGPLDLLLHLIERAEIDIRDIFISEITSQYIEYVNSMEDMDMDMSSEFLTMAARLLYIKSRSLLPKPPRESDEAEEEDPELALIRQLQEYKAIKAASEAMSSILDEANLTHTKLPEEFMLPAHDTIFKGGTPNELFSAFEQILKRLDDEQSENKTEEHRVNADAYTVRGCMNDIRNAFSQNNTVMFEELFHGMYVKMRVIVTFMALLEMVMRGEIRLEQTEPYAPIWITKNEFSEEEALSYEYDDDILDA